MKIKLDISYSVAIYLRLSKDDGDFSHDSDKKESNSIANQKVLILNYIKSLPNTSLYKIYIDDGYSGANFERPDFKRMRDDIYDGKVNMVVVKDLSRFGRDYIDTGRYIQKIFPSLGIRFISILDHFDSLTASQSDINLLLPVKNFVNDNYCRDISQKVRSHQAVMRDQGLYIGSYVAYGYKKSAENKNRIIVDEYAADIVRKIFNWHLNGMSTYSIADKLNNIGVLAPSDYKKTLGINYKSGFQVTTKGKWFPVTVSRILTNRIYTGILEQGKRSTISYKVKNVISKPENEWSVIENSHEAIIPISDFENVRRLQRLDMRTAPDKDKVYLFSGFLFCGDCGRLMVRRVNRYKQKTTVYYICRLYNTKGECSRHSISEETLSNILINAISNHISVLASMTTIMERIEKNGINAEDIVLNDEEISKRYKEFERYTKLMNSLYLDLADDVLTEEEFHQLHDRYQQKCDDIQAQITNLKSEIRAFFLTGIMHNEWIKTFKKYKNITELNRFMMVVMIEKILVYENKEVEIQFKFQDEFRLLKKIVSIAGDLAFTEEEVNVSSQ
ncbi:recombinase family protein [Lachnospiraceae bacterium OttesenSCG-928-D06]|nr:recombinase family protein [Lachnospiraceae bacterium OttesenSCG-928-D06]